MKTEEWRGLPSIHLRVSPELHEILEREASKLGMKLTEFTKFAVITYLRSVNVPIHFQESRDLSELGKQLEEEAHESRRSTGPDSIRESDNGEPASGSGN